MNSRSRYLYLLTAAALLAGACAPAERHQATVERKWTAASISRLELSEVNGSVTVEGGSPNEITLVAKVKSRGIAPDDKADNQGFFDTAISGDTLIIGRRSSRKQRHFFFFDKSDLRVDYELRVPPTVALELQTVNGRITTRGVDGATEANTVNGAIDVLTGGSNELVATTVNGRVRATFLSNFQGAKLKTVNGKVEATLPASASFACEFSQVNGDFEAAFPLRIHSHPGSRRVSGDVNGGRFPLKIVTVNGDIEVEAPRIQAPEPPIAPAEPMAPTAPIAPEPPPAPAVPTT